MKKLNNFFEQILKTKSGKIAFWTILPAVTFICLQFSIQFAMVFIAQFFENPKAIIANPIFTAIYTILFFGGFSAVIYFVPKKFFGQKLSDREVGISKEISWTDIGLGLAGFVVSILISGVLISILKNIFPDFDSNQTQSLGFSGLVRSHEFMLAFICLAIIPPIAEEFVFRGVIYGQLRKINPTFAIFWTSLLFGLAHLQLNVAIVTFVMSAVMCFIREKFTDSIWAGVVLHFIKNAIAFAALYIFPNMMI